MDRMPGAGGPPGAGVDGAFERFLTAAIATIITIMFSWRLLAEEEEAAARGESASALKTTPVQYSQFSSGYDRFDPPLSNQRSQNASSLSDIDLSDNDESAHTSSPANVDIIEKVISERFEPQTQAVLTGAPPSNDDGDLSDISQTDQSGDQETLTTWDEYKWEEELGQEEQHVIKTRRTVRDFAKPQTFHLQSPPKENIGSSDMASIDAVANANSEELASTVKSTVVPFTQRFANFEYKDTGGDSGYVDLYPDSDTSDSSDDENVYEIQVSDSDSDSEGDRGGAFFGVTALDTIMEEYESDYSDICEKGEDRHGGNSAQSIIKSGMRDGVDSLNSGDYNTADTLGLNLENTTERPNILEHLTLNTEVGQSCEKTQNGVHEDYACIPEQNATVTKSNEADKAVCNLSPEISCKAESTPLTQLAGPAMSRDFDLTVSNTSPVNKSKLESGVNNKCWTNTSGLNDKHQAKNSDFTNTDEDAECKISRESAYDKNSAPKETKLPQGKQTETESSMSQVYDDRSPSPPVRTNAIDDIGTDSLSDTESCSSESVITVLSMRSNDSDSYTGDRYDVTSNGQSGHRQLMSPGNTDQSLNINDLRNDGSGSYENNSLVSGFLNDSLNSLLSANNDDTDTESGEGLDDEHCHSVDTDSVQNTPKHSLENKNLDNNSSLHSIASVDTSNSNIESNEIVLEPETIIHETIRPECDGTDVCNEPIVSERHSSDYISADNQLNLENESHFSDGSSDSSDPPLREYDPDDDDLAAFQFNQDSDCDNDSFFLLVGNEGSLRNFDTFTNLNSLGLSPEYGDAVTSHTVSDDARGFKFSYTEEINTDYTERSYFTDRNMSSDSDARSNDPLSPITSEDEEMVATENDKNEKFLIIDSKQNFKTPSAYDDAELSAPVTDETDSNTDQSNAKRAIDFQKYIIQPEPAQQSELIPGGDKIRSQNDHKDVYEIDEDSGSNRSKIDRTGAIPDSLGVTGINNKQAECEEAETFSSLTDKIRSLSVVSESSDSSHSDKETQSKENSSTFIDAENQPENESKTNGNVDTALKSEESSETPVIQGLNQSGKSKETNIDDIFLDTKSDDVDTLVLEIKCSSGRVTDVDKDVLTKSVPTKNSVPSGITTSDVNVSPNGAIETAIDEVFDKDISATTELKPTSLTPLRHKGPKIETNIDDIFDDTNAQSASNSRTNSKIETNVDDIVLEIPTSEEKLSYETFVDDLFQPIVPSSVSQEQSVPRDVTSESAIRQPKTQNIGHTESGPDSRNVISEPNRLENSSSSVRSDEQVLNQQSTPFGISQLNRPAVYTQDNRDPKDKTSDIVDKISDTPLVENNSYLNIAPSNNERQRDSIIKNTNENSQSLRSNVESHSNRDTPKVSDHDQSESVTKQQHFNNDTNNNSEFGLHPDINNSDNYTQDYRPLTHAASSGKLPDNIEDNIEVHGIVSTGDIELKIYEDETSEKSENDDSELLDNLSSAGSSSFVSDDESFNSVDENLLYQYAKLRARGLSESALSRVVRSPLTKPSDLFGRSKDLGQGVKRKVHKHYLKKYTSILQQPITPVKGQSLSLTTPERPPSTSRLKVLQSRQRFLSSENLTGESFEDKFLQHRISLVSSTPRKYLKRHERHLAELQSTESLPTDMSHIAMLNASYDSYTGLDKMHSLPRPRNIEELYGSRYSSANSSFDKPDHHKLHANCIFSPEKREEIKHTTQSLENMFEQLLRYGSISSVAETDLDASVDAPQPQSLQDTDFSQYVSFQYPLERAASMSALTGSSDGERLPRKPGKGRFAKRNVPKSKSLQTLETNLDDVFADERELHGELKKAPSVHELRVSKSLSKLNVPDWFSRSTFSRSDSTQSLFTYAGRLGSTSTLGSYAYPPSIPSSPAPTPGSQTVIIQKRVTPTSTIPASAKLLRAPALPTTPEKAPIHPTGLPSDKYRKTDRKELKPISIVPFAKLRAMFELKSHAHATKSTSPVTSPTKEKAKVRFEPVSPTRDSNATGFSSCRETDIDSRLNELEPVQNRTTSMSPPPPLPERKPILADSARRSEGVPQSNAQPRRTQVHFSDEPNVSKSQEQNSNVVQQNGTSSKPKSTIKKQGLRASLPLPQFRFRRPGPFATKAATAVPAPEPQASQNKKETTV